MEKSGSRGRERLQRSRSGGTRRETSDDAVGSPMAGFRRPSMDHRSEGNFRCVTRSNEFKTATESTPVHGIIFEEKNHFCLEFERNPSNKSSGTPTKTLVNQERARTRPSIAAKLMGLEAFPPSQLVRRHHQKKGAESFSRRFQEEKVTYEDCTPRESTGEEDRDFKDVFEITEDPKGRERLASKGNSTSESDDIGVEFADPKQPYADGVHRKPEGFGYASEAPGSGSGMLPKSPLRRSRSPDHARNSASSSSPSRSVVLKPSFGRANGVAKSVPLPRSNRDNQFGHEGRVGPGRCGSHDLHAKDSTDGVKCAVGKKVGTGPKSSRETARATAEHMRPTVSSNAKKVSVSDLSCHRRDKRLMPGTNKPMLWASGHSDDRSDGASSLPSYSVETPLTCEARRHEPHRWKKVSDQFKEGGGLARGAPGAPRQMLLLPSDRTKREPTSPRMIAYVSNEKLTTDKSSTSSRSRRLYEDCQRRGLVSGSISAKDPVGLKSGSRHKASNWNVVKDVLKSGSGEPLKVKIGNCVHPHGTHKKKPLLHDTGAEENEPPIERDIHVATEVLRADAQPHYQSENEIANEDFSFDRYKANDNVLRYSAAGLTSPRGSKEADRPRTVSVQLPQVEEEASTSCCLERVRKGLKELRTQLRLLRSETMDTRIGDEAASTSSRDEDDESNHRRSIPEIGEALHTSFRDEEDRDRSYIADALVGLGIRSAAQEGRLADDACRLLLRDRHCSEVFAKLEERYGRVDSWKKLDRKLLFNLATAALADILAPHGGTSAPCPWWPKPKPPSFTHEQLAEKVWRSVVVRRAKGNAQELMEREWFEMVQDAHYVDVAGDLAEEVLEELFCEVLMLLGAGASS